MERYHGRSAMSHGREQPNRRRMGRTLAKFSITSVSQMPRVLLPSPIAQADNKEGVQMTRSNLLYLVIGALVVVVGFLGYQYYQDHKEPKGVQLNIGPSGVSIEKK